MFRFVSDVKILAFLPEIYVVRTFNDFRYKFFDFGRGEMKSEFAVCPFLNEFRITKPFENNCFQIVIRISAGLLRYAGKNIRYS